MTEISSLPNVTARSQEPRPAGRDTRGLGRRIRSYTDATREALGGSGTRSPQGCLLGLAGRRRRAGRHNVRQDG